MSPTWAFVEDLGNDLGDDHPNDNGPGDDGPSGDNPDCWYWVFVHSCGVMWCICSDYFSCFLSRLIRWFVAFVLHCFSVFALFVYLKFLCPESLLFSLWHWAQGLYSVASLHNLVSDTGHKSALLWSILTLMTLTTQTLMMVVKTHWWHPQPRWGWSSHFK